LFEAASVAEKPFAQAGLIAPVEAQSGGLRFDHSARIAQRLPAVGGYAQLQLRSAGGDGGAFG